MILRIGIIGCGIAGQAAAIALARDGHDVTVFERFAEARPVGAGLLLQPSGLIALERLGLRTGVEKWGAPVERLYGHTATNRTVMDLRYAKVGDGTTGLGIHRAALFGVLHEGLAQSGAKLELGFEATKIFNFNAPVIVDNKKNSVGPFDLVVDCAGAHDALRRTLDINVEDEPYEWGALWATCADRTGAFMDELRQVYDGTNVMIGILPIGRVPDSGFDGNNVALFWSLKYKQYGAVRAAGVDALRTKILHYWPQSLPIVDEIADMNRYALATYRDVWMKTWRKDRVLVMGDAAHGTSPQLGQGANLALIDAISLASALRKERNVDDALILYSRMRKSHLRYYQIMSRAMTPVFQSNRVVVGWMRDTFFGPMAKIPGIGRIMRTTLTGVRKWPLGIWQPPD